jgi:hypothetical protein
MIQGFFRTYQSPCIYRNKEDIVLLEKMMAQTKVDDNKPKIKLCKIDIP